GVTAQYDADRWHDAHYGEHFVPATPATTPTPATTQTAAQPTTPTGATAVPAVQTAAAVAATAATTVAATGEAAAATHHALAAAGTRPRERAIDHTDPTDIVSHLDDQDLEDLAALLFDRLQTRLRRDLIVDRERSGLLTDFR